MGSDSADLPEPGPDSEWSFDDAWSAISGPSAARASASLHVSIDTSDGRELHEHLARISALLVDHGVLVSAVSTEPDEPEEPDEIGPSVGVSGTGWNVGGDELGLTPGVAEQVITTTASVSSGAAWLSTRVEGALPAFMLEPGYERALDAAIWSGSNRVSIEFGSMLADQIVRALRSRGETDAPPALVLPPRLAEAVGTLLPREVPGLVVLGYDAIPEGTQVECVEMLRCPVPPYAAPDAGLDQHTVEVRPEDMGEAADWNW